MIEEIWKVYKTCLNGKRVYEVSNYGNVRINGSLVDTRTHNGYSYIGGFHVHRAVAKLFIPNPENKTQIDHIDTNRKNNNVYNLHWVTPDENNKNPITGKKRGLSNTGKKRKPYKQHKQHKLIKDTSKMGRGTLGKHRLYNEDGTYKYI